jgi:HEPN domain-containing protein/predicted nucleotidyltransferase
MRTSATHIPKYKQAEINEITNIIKSVVAPEKIILFGSYAKDEWVEDEYMEEGIRYQYVSDYDFLVVTSKTNEKEYLIQDKIVNGCRDRYKTPVNVLIHDIDYVNEGLEIGQYFFTDIIKEGVLLYDSNKVEFAKPRELSKTEQKQIAQRYFGQWYTRGKEFLIDAVNATDRNSHNNAAFYLHQTAENFYNTILLVFTGYKPKTHNLEKLRQYIKSISPEVYAIIPASSEKEEWHLFELLKKGYIDARYKNDYLITEEELKELIDRLEKMKGVVEKVCGERIRQFGN